MTHHPHIHVIVPGGGLLRDGSSWISSRPAFLLPVRALGKLFRRLFLTRLMALHEAGRLALYGSLAHHPDRSHDAMNGHGPIHSRHAITALPATVSLVPATPPAADPGGLSVAVCAGTTDPVRPISRGEPASSPAQLYEFIGE